MAENDHSLPSVSPPAPAGGEDHNGPGERPRPAPNAPADGAGAVKLGQRYLLAGVVAEVAPDSRSFVLIVGKAEPAADALKRVRVTLPGVSGALPSSAAASLSSTPETPMSAPRAGQYVKVVAVVVAVGPATVLAASTVQAIESAKPGKPDKPAADAPADDQDAEGDDQAEPAASVFKPGFLNRIWKVSASVSSFEDGRLSVIVDRFAGLPKRLGDQDDALLDQDAVVLVSASVHVLDADGRRVSAEHAAAALDGADSVVLQVKLLAPRKWVQDEDGSKVPTFRAKRIKISA
jgi:hypothetical protein